jgi:hypothetical protein
VKKKEKKEGKTAKARGTYPEQIGRKMRTTVRTEKWGREKEH